MKYTLIIIVTILFFGCTSSEKSIDFETTFGKQEQVFMINNKLDTTIVGQNGTVITIPSNLSKNDSLKLILREFYSKSEMVLAGLSTTSNDRLLETGGMIQLNIFTNNEILKPLCDLEIKFPTDNKNENYYIFNGNFTDSKINWTRDTITENYHIYYNVVLKGENDDCDKAWDTTRLDTTLWAKGYTKIDSIITFTESNDTLQYPDYWRNSDLEFLDELVKLEPQIMTSYRLSKLDWINCDRFVNIQELTNINIESNAQDKPYYFLVFEDLNSIMVFEQTDMIENVPVNQKAKIIGLEKIDNRMLFDITESFVIESNMTVKMILKETDNSVIEDKIKSIDE